MDTEEVHMSHEEQFERTRLLLGESALEKLDEGMDVIITTYNMLKRDIDLYREKEFRFCFLDEAQHIKNPVTQNARSVKKLKTNGYFALTGTPI